MNAPDPANEPQTPELSKIDRAMAVLEAALQPDALARLEAWLAEDSNREVEIEQDVCFVPQPRRWHVTIWTQKERFASSGLGLAATIDAALKKAESLKL